MMLNFDEQVSEKRKLGIVLGGFMANYALSIVRTEIRSHPNPTYEPVCQMVRGHWLHEIALEVQRMQSTHTAPTTTNGRNREWQEM